MVATQSTTTTTWTIDPKHSLVEMAVKHMMVTTVKGQFTGVTGTLTIDEHDPIRSAVDVTIDAATLTTHEAQRDAHLRSPDFLDVATYPTIQFTSRHVESLGGGDLRVTGDLTIRGVTRPIDLIVAHEGAGVTPFGASIVAYSATTTIKRSDFGLNWNVALEAGGMLVSDSVKISLEIQAVRQ